MLCSNSEELSGTAKSRREEFIDNTNRNSECSRNLRRDASDSVRRAPNRRYAVVVSLLLASVLALLLIVRAYPKFKKIEKRGPAPETVVEILPDGVNTVAALVRAVFNNWSDFDKPNGIGNFQSKFPYDSRWGHLYLCRKDDPQHPGFPSDKDILANRGIDNFAERYVHIPPDLRVQDYYLYEPSGDYYWESEYFYNGKPAKFRCGFLIHMEPARISGTKVELFEYQPTVWVGEYFGITAHALLPTMLHDIRFVESTTIDRTDLMDLIRKTERSQNEDKIR